MRGWSVRGLKGSMERKVQGKEKRTRRKMNQIHSGGHDLKKMREKRTLKFQHWGKNSVGYRRKEKSISSPNFHYHLPSILLQEQQTVKMGEKRVKK